MQNLYQFFSLTFNSVASDDKMVTVRVYSYYFLQNYFTTQFLWDDMFLVTVFFANE